MFFSDEDIQRITNEYQTISVKRKQLTEDFVIRKFSNQNAQEHAQQGFSRRLRTLDRCIHNIFEIAPPDSEIIPEIDAVKDIDINLHAFIFNVIGCIDNLAWIWVCEKTITKEDGTIIPNNHVGLRKNNKLVRKSFSQELQVYLTELDEWFEYLEDFRHSLAHRIPLYVPPYSVLSSNIDEYRELEKQKTNALNCRRLEEYENLLKELEALEIFWPLMKHSFIENSRPVYFHPQILADFNTIESVGRKILNELNK